MKAKKIIAFILLNLFLFTVHTNVLLAETTTITLDEAIELALKNSPDIKKVRTDLELADITALNAKLDYESAYTKWAGTNFNNAAFEADDKAKRKIWEAAEDNLKDARRLVEDTPEKVKYGVETQYLTIMNSKSQLEVLEAQLKNLQNKVRIEKVKLDLGLSTSLQVSQLSVQTDSAANSLRLAQNSLSNMYMEFNRTIGKELNNPVQLAPVFFEEVKYDDKTASEKAALATSLLLQQYNRNIKNKTQDAKDLNENSSEKAQKLKVEIEQLKLSVENTTYDIQNAVKAAFDKMELALKKINEQKLNMETTKNNYENLRIQYELGIISQQTFNEASALTTQAESAYEKAVFDYYLATREAALAQKAIFVTSAGY